MTDGGREDVPCAEKRARLQVDPNVHREGTLDSVHYQYTALYNDLKRKALSDIKTMVRKHVEGVSTESDSYRFMNIYGLCTFDAPNMATLRAGELPTCEFTKVCYPHDSANTNSHNLITVSGIISPLLSARMEHGQLDFANPTDSDYDRSVEEYARLDARSRMRAPRVALQKNLGSTLSSMENRFVFTIREDLHTLGLTYRRILVTIELLHLNMLHFIHS